jgi:hypothetical protein
MAYRILHSETSLQSPGGTFIIAAGLHEQSPDTAGLDTQGPSYRAEISRFPAKVRRPGTAQRILSAVINGALALL